MSGEGQAERYDAVTYPNLVHGKSHPRTVGAMAALHGLDVAPPEDCRVLDLGCGTATNLMSMAFDLPQSTFVGVDIAARQIELGREHAAALGLQNTTLHATSVDELPGLEPFDYIVIHGVYTWVAPEVRDTLLASARRLLKPEGVLYVSYNCYPGWHFGNVVRELFVRRTDPNAPPLVRVQQARDVLEATFEASDKRSLVSAAMHSEIDFIRSMSDSYLLHEYFEPDQDALYFEDFVRHAYSHRLQYVANGRSDNMLTAVQAPAIRKVMEQTDNRLMQQQLFDHLCGTRFRRTLLCRSDRPAPALAIRTELIERLHARLPRRDAVRHEEGHLILELQEDRRIRMPPGPLADWIGMLHTAWPSTVPLRSLLELAGAERDNAGSAVAQLFFTGAIELSLSPITAASSLTERPVSSELARIQAQYDPSLVCSRIHRSESLEPLEWDVLQLLDGTRTLDEVAAELKADRAEVQEMAEGLVERCLLVDA